MATERRVHVVSDVQKGRIQGVQKIVRLGAAAQREGYSKAQKGQSEKNQTGTDPTLPLWNIFHSVLPSSM
jgi:hypothetical protein